MRSRRPDPAHQDAVSRRLALLSAELAASRPVARSVAEPDSPHDPHDAGVTDDQAPWWDEHTRVAAPRRPPPATTTPDPASGSAPAVPVPGRHAARRSGRPPSLLPETLRGRVLLGPAQLAVVAVLVSVGLAATAWWVVRSDPEPADDLAAAAPVGAAVPTLAAEPTVGAATPSTPATVTVDVAGKVRRPGIAVLDAGARVVDAIEAAGGVRVGADVAGLNLARVLVDGEQVLVGVPPVPGVAAPEAAPPEAGATLVDLNTADATQLDSLPEVGPVTAESILAWRDEHGGFASVDQLLEVDGIGEATLAKIAPHVTV